MKNFIKEIIEAYKTPKKTHLEKYFGLERKILASMIYDNLVYYKAITNK